MDDRFFKRSLSALSGRISRLTTPRREYPVFDTVVTVYVAVVLLFQILLQISPVVTLMSYTPLINIQAYLGILGAVLIVVDLFTSKRIWQGTYCVFLFAICALALFSSVRMISYGVKESLYKLCWGTIQFAVYYSCVRRLRSEKLKKFLKILYIVVLVVWLIACCISLYQFACQIGYKYVVNPMAQDSSANRQGFYDNRLFGIFYTLNHAAYTSLLFFLIGLVSIFKAKRTRDKILLAISNVILLCYIILSVSRSAMYALLACIFCMTFLLVRSKLKMKSMHRLLLSTVAAVLAVVLSFYALQGLKLVLSDVPDVTVEESDLPSVDPDKNRLDRELGDDESNGRMNIWRDYLSLYKEVGPIGLSLGNYMPYIKEHHPELYIVDYVKETYPDLYESGIIYHMHSGYLMVYVTAGWIGALMMIAFIILCAIRLCKKLAESHRTPYTILCAFLLVAAGGISAMVDEGVFFQNNPQTTVFWLALGVLMKECSSAEKKTKSAQEEN